MLKSRTNSIYSRTMEAFAPTVDQKKLLQPGSKISFNHAPIPDLGKKPGFKVEYLSSALGIVNATFVNFDGEIKGIIGDYVYLEMKGFTYRIEKSDFLLAILESDNLDLVDLVTDTVSYYNNQTIDNFSQSRAFDKVLNIGATEHVGIEQTFDERMDGIPMKYNPVWLTMHFAPNVYYSLYAGNKPELKKVKEIFEANFQDFVSSLFGTDNVFSVLRTYPEIISTIDEEIAKDYDQDNKLALDFIKKLIIELKQYLNPEEVSISQELNKRINCVLPTAIPGRYLQKEKRIEEMVSVLEGTIINNINDELTILTADGILVVNKHLAKLADRKVKEQVLQIFAKHLEDLTEDKFQALVIEFRHDLIGIVSEDVFNIMIYIEDLIKSNKTKEGINIIKQLAII